MVFFSGDEKHQHTNTLKHQHNFYSVEKSKSLFIWLELIWWVVTALIAVGVLLPIYQSTVDYPFWGINILFIIAAVTLARLIFLTKFTFLAERKYLKFALILITAPIVFFFINQLVNFQTYLDEIGIDDVLKHLQPEHQESMLNYIRTEMIFFGTAAIISMIIFPLKMVKSIWRNFNPER